MIMLELDSVEAVMKGRMRGEKKVKMEVCPFVDVCAEFEEMF